MRRTLVLLLALMLLCEAAAETLCVATDFGCALLDESGAEIIPFGKYADLIRLKGDERFAVGEATEDGIRYAMCDADGRLLTDFAYETLCAEGGVVLFRQDGRMGAMSPLGELRVPPKYAQLIPLGENRYYALTADPTDDAADEILLLESDGTALPTGILTSDGLHWFRSGRMAYRAADERCGYLDGEGKIAVEPRFDEAATFSRGLAIVSENGRFGVIHPDGTALLPTEYRRVLLGERVLALGDGFATLFTRDGASIFTMRGSLFGMAGAYPYAIHESALTVFDPDGNPLATLPPDTTVGEGIEGQLIAFNGEWGADGARVLGAKGDRRFQWLLRLDGARYAFMEMTARSYRSDLADERYSCDYDTMRFGLTDGEEIILPAEYEEIRALGGNRYLLIAEDGLRIVDGEGVEIRHYIQ